VEILTPQLTESSRPAACPPWRPAAGCDWQHASLPAQRAPRPPWSASQLRRIAGSIARWWSNRWQATTTASLAHQGAVRVGNDGVAGLRGIVHQVIKIGDCPIAESAGPPHPGDPQALHGR